MASPLSSFLAILFIITSAFASHNQHHIHKLINFELSTISAAPTLLPSQESPYPSPLPPSLSPDVQPELPTTPGANSPSPADDSSIPTIPATPSPPNPDAAMDSPDAVAASSPFASPIPPPVSSSPLFSTVSPPLLLFPLFSLCF
ncbi:hypothetical protein LINGRAHAP2_LOCUS20048 [Linum grandiflorum]